ncbi:MAG: ATP-binding cassette domain-containing protein [Bacteriovoracaceae bacterium]|jgi:osmoprotectant transport system ATP-binding protein|nr:ATP-binding cassette domain-containing protein [Bacteriovoracaceae bacterium]
MIDVKNLTKIFPHSNTPAVDNISFNLDVGQIGCLIGTSGCGKTTTLKMLNKLIEPSSGTIKINNQETQNLDAVDLRRKIGYVIQKAGLFPHMTIQENISILSTILKREKREIKSRVSELLDLVRLSYSEFAHRYPSELSGGQQQRVGIARALMENPPVLLMDEPFGALDPLTKDSMHDEFYNLNRKLGKTILIVTHDLTEAFKLGDKVLLMDNGSIVQAGTKSDFINSPVNDFVKDFIKGNDCE